MGFNFWWQVEAECGAMVSSSQGTMHPISKLKEANCHVVKYMTTEFIGNM
jgi:hypothetical protein